MLHTMSSSSLPQIRRRKPPPRRVLALLITVLVVLLLLSGCGARGLVRSELAGRNMAGPQRVMVVPADFVITEITFGKTEERVVPAERHAAQVLADQVDALSSADHSFETQHFSGLSTDEQQTLLQHRALFATMVSQLLLVKEDAIDAWKDKERYFDYSLGPGMREIAERHGIDTVIFVVGKDKVRSTSRKVLDAITAVLPLGESLSSQPAVVVLGVVEMRTGEIQMFDSDTAARKALTDDDDVRALGKSVLTDFRSSIKDRSKAS